MKYLTRISQTDKVFFFFFFHKTCVFQCWFWREYLFLSGRSAQDQNSQQAPGLKWWGFFSASETLKSTGWSYCGFSQHFIPPICLTVYVDRRLLRSLFWTFPSQMPGTLFTPSFWNQSERIFSVLFSVLISMPKAVLNYAAFVKLLEMCLYKNRP